MTAQNLFPTEATWYNNFPITNLVDNSVTDFDLFLKLGDGIVLYASNGYHWIKEELSALIANGYSDFLTLKTDTKKANMYLQIAQIPKVEKNLPPFERIKSLEQIGSQFIKALYEGEITPACVKKSEEIARTLADCIDEDRTCIKAISGLADHDYYTYYHSIRVATYALAISVEMGLSDHRQMKEIVVGGIFHDIGKKEVGLEIINKTGSLTEDEWAQMKSHPEYGLASINDANLSHIPQEIILHHHEKLDGSGYPHGIGSTSLLPEVQIATLADVFDALTSSRTYQNKRSRYEALQFIKDKMVGPKLPYEAFSALISCLK
ncbi:MAG: HD domain-containing protein [Pseudobacteriovorax sp.]|nr:HD domain-containing protein [Pseudobacteriovorax sp.]